MAYVNGKTSPIVVMAFYPLQVRGRHPLWRSPVLLPAPRPLRSPHTPPSASTTTRRHPRVLQAILTPVLSSLFLGTVISTSDAVAGSVIVVGLFTLVAGRSMDMGAAAATSGGAGRATALLATQPSYTEMVREGTSLLAGGGGAGVLRKGSSGRSGVYTAPHSDEALERGPRAATTVATLSGGSYNGRGGGGGGNGVHAVAAAPPAGDSRDVELEMSPTTAPRASGKSPTFGKA